MSIFINVGALPAPLFLSKTQYSWTKCTIQQRVKMSSIFAILRALPHAGLFFLFLL